MSQPVRSPHSTKPPRRADEAGLTLVELLVTIVIASIVAASTFLFFAGQKTVYETQTKLLNIQQNLWAAMETLARNVRAAGAGMVGCVRPDSDGPGIDTGDPPPTGAVPPATGLRAWLAHPRPPYNTGPTAARLAPIWIQNGVAGTPDTITVVYGLGASGNFVDAQLGGTVSNATMPITTVAGTPSPAAAFLPNEFILLVHTGNPALNGDRGCTLLQLTGVNTTTHTLAVGSTSPWNQSGTNTGLFTWGNPAAPGSYTSAQSGIRNFGQLRWIRFQIDTTRPVPNLTMQRLDQVTSTGVAPAQILAEGVEDLQIAYGCDTTGPTGVPDGLLTEGLPTPATDEWIFNAAGDVPPPACNRPQAIRITVIARSATADNTLSDLAAAGLNFKPAAEDGVAGAPDRFRHRVMRTTIVPRN